MVRRARLQEPCSDEIPDHHQQHVDRRTARVGETHPVEALTAEWSPSSHVRHIRVNDSNRRGPGRAGTASRR